MGIRYRLGWRRWNFGPKPISPWHGRLQLLLSSGLTPLLFFLGWKVFEIARAGQVHTWLPESYIDHIYQDRFRVQKKLQPSDRSWLTLPTHEGSIFLSSRKPMVCCFSHVFEYKPVIVFLYPVLFDGIEDTLVWTKEMCSYIFCDRNFHNKLLKTRWGSIHSLALDICNSPLSRELFSSVFHY